jgi:hypothetical protein
MPPELVAPPALLLPVLDVQLDARNAETINAAPAKKIERTQNGLIMGTSLVGGSINGGS